MTVSSSEWDPNRNPFGEPTLPTGVGSTDIPGAIHPTTETGPPVYPATPHDDILPPHLRQPVFDEPSTQVETTDLDGAVATGKVFDWETDVLTWSVEVPSDGIAPSTIDDEIVTYPPVVATSGALAVTNSMGAGNSQGSLLSQDRKELRRARRAENAELARLAAEAAEAERQASLAERAEESVIRFAEAALNLQALFEFPTTVKGNDGSRSALYKPREVKALFLSRFVNGVVSSEVTEALSRRYPTLESPVEIKGRVESAIDSKIAKLEEEQRLSADQIDRPAVVEAQKIEFEERFSEYSELNTFRTSVTNNTQLLTTIGLLEAVARDIDKGGRNSIFNKTDAEVRRIHDEATIAAMEEIINDAIFKATEEFIINPFPVDDARRGIPHRVHAFEVLQKALGLSEQEATIDDYNTQPAVVTRLIYDKDGNITVDPDVDGIGKLFESFGYTPDDSFGGFTFYETTLEGRPDPRNITGLVQKTAPYNAYGGYFAVHMKIGSVSVDDTMEDPGDGSIAFLAKFLVNPLLVKPEMNTIIVSGMSKELITSGMQAQPISHPIELAKSSVFAIAGVALPGEQMLVEAAITANRAGQEHQRTTLVNELAQVNDTLRARPFPPPAIGTALIAISADSTE